MKPILKQKSHLYEVYNKSYKVIKSHIFRLGPKVLGNFAYFQPN